MLVVEELNDFILFVFDIFEFILICFLFYNQFYGKSKQKDKEEKKNDEKIPDEPDKIINLGNIELNDDESNKKSNKKNKGFNYIALPLITLLVIVLLLNSGTIISLFNQ